MTAVDEPGLTSVTQTHYEQIRRRYLRGCDEGSHGDYSQPARAIVDRDGMKLWICGRGCPAYAEFGTGQAWRTP